MIRGGLIGYNGSALLLSRVEQTRVDQNRVEQSKSVQKRALEGGTILASTTSISPSPVSARSPVWLFRERGCVRVAWTATKMGLFSRRNNVC
jgi:hypothetical protein